MHTLGKRFVPLCRRCAFHSQNAPGDHEESPHAQNPKTGGIPEVYRQRRTLRNQEWESEGEICRVIRKLILVAEGAVSGVVCAGGYFLTPSACFQWTSLNTGVYWPVGLYFPKAGATELYSLYRLCVITEQRQEGCSALKQHNPTSNPHSNHLLPPSEKERLTERGMDECRPEAKIHRSEFFSPWPSAYGTGVKVPSRSPEWMDGW